jgi:hypothetical protein
MEVGVQKLAKIAQLYVRGTLSTIFKHLNLIFIKEIKLKKKREN